MNRKLTIEEKLNIEEYIGFNDIINNKVDEKKEKVKTFIERKKVGYYDSIREV